MTRHIIHQDEDFTLEKLDSGDIHLRGREGRVIVGLAVEEEGQWRADISTPDDDMRTVYKGNHETIAVNHLWMSRFRVYWIVLQERQREWGLDT